MFDEDCNSHDNVHSIFREDGARIYEKDLSMNPSVFSAKFIRAFYDVSKHDFVNEMYKKARYYWNNGNVLRIEWNGSELVKTELLIFISKCVKCVLKCLYKMHALKSYQIGLLSRVAEKSCELPFVNNRMAIFVLD